MYHIRFPYIYSKILFHYSLLHQWPQTLWVFPLEIQILSNILLQKYLPLNLYHPLSRALSPFHMQGFTNSIVLSAFDFLSSNSVHFNLASIPIMLLKYLWQK